MTARSRCATRYAPAQRKQGLGRPDDPATLEGAARAALEARHARPLPDEEWARAKDDLLALFELLATWDAPIAPNDESQDTRLVSLAIQDGTG